MSWNVGHNNANAKLTPDQVIEIRKLFKAGERKSTIARKYNVHRTTIARAISFVHWKDISPDLS